jgi:hypothetical protein
MKIIGEHIYNINKTKDDPIIFDFANMKNNEKYIERLKIENEENHIYLYSILRYSIALDNVEAFHFLYSNNLVSACITNDNLKCLMDILNSPKIEKYLLEQKIALNNKLVEKIKL